MYVHEPQDFGHQNIFIVQKVGERRGERKGGEGRGRRRRKNRSMATDSREKGSREDYDKEEELDGEKRSNNTINNENRSTSQGKTQPRQKLHFPSSTHRRCSLISMSTHPTFTQTNSHTTANVCMRKREE